MTIKHKALLITVGWLVIMLALFGCSNEQTETKTEETVIPVQTALATQGSLSETAVVTGKLEALATSNVVPSGQGGKVAAVNVKVGNQVSQGQTLITLENTAEATLQAAIRQAEQGVAQAEKGVAQAESNLELARINFEQASDNYERGKQLYESGAIPQAGQAGFETAYEIPYKQAKVTYEQVAPATLASAQAAVAATKAAVDVAKANYEQQHKNSYIKSPINGVVTAINVKPGELASPGSPTPVVTVVNLATLEVKTTVTESQINKIKQGQQVPVKISAVSSRPFTGVITEIALAADPASKSYPIKVQINNAEHTLKPGMYAEVQMENVLPATLLVPRDAVVKKGDTDIVWGVDKERAKPIEVTVGASDGKSMQILGGLQAGDQVVTTGQNMLKDGAKVEIKSQVK